MKEYEIKYLKLSNGKEPIVDWLNSLDKTTKTRIVSRLDRINEGNFGDFKKLSDDISELRFKFGKGYRIYYTEYNDIIILLINGGDKSDQQKDIENAKKLLQEWRIINEI